MRILTVCYEYPPIGGGGGVVAEALAQQLVRMGHDLEVVTSQFRALAAREQEGGLTIHRHACRRRHRHYTTATELLTTLWPAYRKAAGIIRDNPPHLLHAHFALPSGLVAYHLSRRFGIPYVLTVHGSDIPGYNPDRFHWHHRLVRPIWRRVMSGASEIVSPSRYLAGLVRQQIQLPVQIVPNGYMGHSGSGEQPKRRLVLVVARLFPRKGVQYFLEAIRDLDSDWEFVVAGDGPYMASLKALAGTVRPHVRFTGFIDKPSLQSLYAEARILVFPSLQENFPMVLLEGMDAGCAVITSQAHGCAEVVGDAGVIVPPANAMALGKAIRELLADPERCDLLAARSRARAALFRWPRIAELYLQVFNDAMRWRAGGAHAGRIG